MASLGEDLLVTVNKLQDLVFNTIGNDSLDLPQIVSDIDYLGPDHCVLIALGRRRLSIVRQVVGLGEHCRARFLTTRQRHRHATSVDSTAHQYPQRARR